MQTAIRLLDHTSLCERMENERKGRGGGGGERERERKHKSKCCFFR